MLGVDGKDPASPRSLLASARSPAATRLSLLASARSTPASSAASVAGSPAKPTTAFRTTSGALASTSAVERRVAADRDELDAALAGDRPHLVAPAPRRERAELELRVRVDDLERLAPDRARRAEKGHPSHALSLRPGRHLTSVTLRPVFRDGSDPDFTIAGSAHPAASYDGGVLRYSVDELIPASSDEVFAELLDSPSHAQWMPGVVEAGYRTAGPPAVGHKGYEVRSFYGVRVESELVVTELDRPRLIGLTFTSGRRVSGTARFSLASEGERTRIRAHVEVEGVPRLLRTVAARAFERMDRKALRALRARFGGRKDGGRTR